LGFVSDSGKGDRHQPRQVALEGVLDELRRASRHAALGMRAAEVAHDLRNTVSLLTGNLQVLDRYFSDLLEMVDAYNDLDPLLGPAEREALQKLREMLRVDLIRADVPKIFRAASEGAERSRSLLDGILDYARGVTSTPFESVDLGDCLARTMGPIEHAHGGKVAFVRELQSVPPVSCQLGRIVQLVENLLVNAVQALPSGGHVWVGLRPSDRPNHVVVSIRDDGTGIRSDLLERVFEPFFTTKPRGQGTGLGLAIAKEIAQEHQGEIAIHSTVGKGTTVEVTLPVAPTQGGP
jgi:signal transduction histidine kinase